MKLVVISHACITPQNQEFFQRIAEVAGWDVTIILPNRWKTVFKNRYTAEKLPSFKGKIIPTGVFFQGMVGLHFYSFSVFGAIRRERPDAIYMHNEPYALSTFQILLYNLLFLRKPIGFYAAQNLRKKYLLPFLLIGKFSFKVADYCCPITESAAVVLREEGFSKKIAVIPLGVTENHLRVPERIDMAADSGAPKPFVIGYVGRLVPEKGLEVLFRALALLKSSDWECQIVGDGKMKDELVNLSVELAIDSKIKFLGYVGHGEISRNMRDFSVLALPSLTVTKWAEQFGRVIIEALVADVPVIGSDSGEIPYLIRKLEGGIVVKEGDPVALAGAIETLISDRSLARNYAERGKENVKKYFLESKIAEDFVSEITEVMRSR